MQPPYTAEVLAAFVGRYNEAIWPVQMIAVFLILVSLYGVFRPTPVTDRLIGLILTAFWVWTGYVFYIREFSSISFLAPVYGGFFLFQAALIVWFSVLRHDLQFRYTNDWKGRAGLACLALALIVYPLIVGSFEGQWESLRLAGITPVPTVLFTLGFLLMADAKIFRKPILTVIPILFLLAALMTGLMLIGSIHS